MNRPDEIAALADETKKSMMAGETLGLNPSFARDLAERQIPETFQQELRELRRLATPTPPSADAANYIEALTPSASTKAAYISEFHFTVPDGSGERRVTVPWDTIKQIMSAIREKAIS